MFSPKLPMWRPYLWLRHDPYSFSGAAPSAYGAASHYPMSCASVEEFNGKSFRSRSSYRVGWGEHSSSGSACRHPVAASYSSRRP